MSRCVIIWGERDDLSDHDEALDKFLQVTQKHGLCLGFDKIQYKKDEINFYMDMYTVNGHKPAKEKKKAIAEMPMPTNVKELQSFLGVCNFLLKYSPRLAELSDDLASKHVKAYLTTGVQSTQKPSMP